MAAFICIVVILHLSSAASIIRKPGGDECNGVVCGEDLICANKLNSSSNLTCIQKQQVAPTFKLLAYRFVRNPFDAVFVVTTPTDWKRVKIYILQDSWSTITQSDSLGDFSFTTRGKEGSLLLMIETERCESIVICFESSQSIHTTFVPTHTQSQRTTPHTQSQRTTSHTQSQRTTPHTQSQRTTPPSTHISSTVTRKSTVTSLRTSSIPSTTIHTQSTITSNPSTAIVTPTHVIIHADHNKLACILTPCVVAVMIGISALIYHYRECVKRNCKKLNCKKIDDTEEDFTVIRMTDLLIDNIEVENDDAEGSFLNPVFDDDFEHIYL